MNGSVVRAKKREGNIIYEEKFLVNLFAPRVDNFVCPAYNDAMARNGKKARFCREREGAPSAASAPRGAGSAPGSRRAEHAVCPAVSRVKAAP